jgi:hypothetical protein
MVSTIGYIYCLSNPSFEENVYKIGFTSKTPQQRALQLYKTGVPTPFNVELYKCITDYKTNEKKVHKILKQYRINDQREFFRVSLSTIDNIFSLIPEYTRVNKRRAVFKVSNGFKRKKLNRKAKIDLVYPK